MHRVIEDNNSHEDPKKVDGWGGTERYIKEVRPRHQLPGVGLPEIIEETALELTTKS